MAAKADAKDSKEAAPAPEKAAPEKAAPAAGGGGGGARGRNPAIAAIILAPAASCAVAQFVLLPKLKTELGGAGAHAPAGEHAADPAAAAAPAEGEGHGKKKGGHGEKEEGGSANYEFSNVVVNLAGTMGTRYL